MRVQQARAWRLPRVIAAMALVGLFAAQASADPLDDRVRSDYFSRSSRPRAATFPRSMGSGVYQSPNGTAITKVVTVEKPPVGVADGITRMGYYSRDEDSYWVHVTGGIAGFNKWEGPFKLPAASNAIAFTTIARGAQSGAQANTAEALVLQTQAEWNAAMSQHRNLGGLAAPDFRQVTVLVRFMGIRNTGGYGTQITKVEQGTGEVVVTYEDSSPAPGTMVTMALTAPYHVVSIPKTADAVRFQAASTTPAPAPLSLRSVDRGSQSRDQRGSPTNLVFTDASAFNSFWSTHSAGPRPVVDFTSETAVAVLMGERPSAGYGVSVTGLRREGGDVVLEARFQGPPAGSFQATVLTYPYDIVVVNEANASIRVDVDDQTRQSLEFTGISFDLRNASARTAETLTIEASGAAVYEALDPATGAVLKRHSETLVPAHIQAISGLVASADAYNLADPSRQPGFAPPAGAALATLRVEDTATGRENKVSYAAAPAQAQGLHDELMNLVRKFGNVAVANLGFTKLTLTDTRPQPATGGNWVRTITVNADGTAESFVTAPNIRSVPVRGRVSSQDMARVVQQFAAAQVFTTSWPVLRPAPGSPLTSFVAEDGARVQSVGHVTNQTSAELQLLEDTLRNLVIVEAAKGFDSLSYSETLNGFILATKTIAVTSSGQATWTEVQNGAVTKTETGTLSAAELQDISQLFAAADVFNQSFPAYLPSAGAQYVSLSATLGAQLATATHDRGSPTGGKPAELAALEARLAALIKRGPQGASPYDALDYAVTTLATKDTASVRVQGDTATWTRTAAGATTTGTFALSLAERDNLEQLAVAADLFNQPATFPQLVRIAKTHEYSLGIEAGGRTHSITASTYAAEPLTVRALRSALDALLAKIPAAPTTMTIEGRINLIKTQPPQVTLTEGATTWMLSGKPADELALIAGRFAKVEGNPKGAKGFEVTRIISPEALIIDGEVQVSGSDVAFAKDAATVYPVVGSLTKSLARFAGDRVSVRGLLYESGKLEVLGIFTKTNRFSFALPFDFLAQGTELEILEQVGDYSVARIGSGASARLIGISTKNLDPRTVTSVTSGGLTGGLSGSRNP